MLVDPLAFAQLVPSLPPPAEGVGSYALCLAEGWTERAGHIIVSSKPLPTASSHGIDVLSRRRMNALIEALESAGNPPLLVHYANYGYARRGCPVWLVSGLRKWKRTTDQRLVTVFHEVCARGMPWESSYWLSGLQLRLARELSRWSDHSVTSLSQYSDLLSAGSRHRSPEILPVYSTIGEPRIVQPLEARTRRVVVFGGVGARSRAYRESLFQLETACRTADAEEIVDVGTGCSSPPSQVAERPIRILGEASDRLVSDLLADSYAGFLSYWPEFLPKSTIFAAYCAHGVVPICAPIGSPPSREVPPFARPETPASRHLELQEACRRWYSAHSLCQHISLLDGWLFGSGTTAGGLERQRAR